MITGSMGSMHMIKGEKQGEGETRDIARECLCVSERETGRRERQREIKIGRLIETDR